MDRPADLYGYRAVLKRVVDGDTVVLDIDLGCEIWLRNEHCRLYGINTPEMRGPERPEGIIAKEWVQMKLHEGDPVLIRTYRDKKGKYGRWLVHLWHKNAAVSINEQLIDEGLAERI